MPDLVCTGATLECSFGTTSATFSATGAMVSAGAAAGTVTDTATANVPPFGTCESLSNPQVNAATQAAGGALTPQPCQPVIASDWTPGAPRVKAGPAAALSSASQCSCTWGGVITVTSAGQSAATLG